MFEWSCALLSHFLTKFERETRWPSFSAENPTLKLSENQRKSVHSGQTRCDSHILIFSQKKKHSKNDDENDERISAKLQKKLLWRMMEENYRVCEETRALSSLIRLLSAQTSCLSCWWASGIGTPVEAKQLGRVDELHLMLLLMRKLTKTRDKINQISSEVHTLVAQSQLFIVVIESNNNFLHQTENKSKKKLH